MYCTYIYIYAFVCMTRHRQSVAETDLDVGCGYLYRHHGEFAVYAVFMVCCTPRLHVTFPSNPP